MEESAAGENPEGQCEGNENHISFKWKKRVAAKIDSCGKRLGCD